MPGKITCSAAPRFMKTKYFLFSLVLGVAVLITIVSIQTSSTKEPPHEKNKAFKYILQWTLPYTIPFNLMGIAQQTFLKGKCTYTNCFVTPNKKYFADIRDFDAIAFHGPEIQRADLAQPHIRSDSQIYIFASLESSHYYTLCKPEYQDFFNWTWTYKLDSTIPFVYLIVRDMEGNYIGPRKNMKWIESENLMPIRKYVKRKLSKKSKAVAWLVSNCDSRSKREKYAEQLKGILSAQYQLSLDVFGKCGDKCGESLMEDCWDLIEREYYFYLSFENSFSEDYVTEKLLNPLKHYTVPIVFGEANYSRFVPEGAYINAMNYKPAELAKKIYEIMSDREKYYSYFKWRNHYSFEDPDDEPDTNNYCRLCEMLNNRTAVETTSRYENFLKWWNPPGSC